jgi:drug/metabolite transporter (DMT)-like permease
MVDTSTSGTHTSSLRTALAATAASVCFGASVVATRYAVAQTHAVSLAFIRYAIASLCLVAFVRRNPLREIASRDRWAIAALGALFFGVFPWSFSAALTHNPSARVAIMIATTPLVTLVISRLRGFDQITIPKLLGQLLAFSGLFIALRPSASGASGVATPWIGDALTALTVACGAVFNVFSRPYLKRYPPLQVTTLSMIAGAVFLAPIAATQGFFTSLPAFTPTGWAAVLFLGTLGGAVGFGLWIWALQRSTPSRVAVFITLNPVTAIALGALLLRERVTTAFLVGFAFVLTGIAMANSKPATG